jgi:hypothetical protein
MLINSEPNSFQIGLDGFYWFLGVVEDVSNDPLKIGRCKVRILGWHDDTLSINDLPWAFPIRPVTQSRVPSDLRVRDWVVGFFLDGKIGQQPMIFGVLPSVAQ